ncbi:MAG: helix-turn-helix transcriptional regulator [Kineosporiaceae bacterium]
MTSPGDPLPTFTRFESNDPEVIAEATRRMYGSRTRVGELVPGGILRVERFNAGRYLIGRVAAPLEYSHGVAGLGSMMVSVVDVGRVERSLRGDVRRYVAGDVYADQLSGASVEHLLQVDARFVILDPTLMQEAAMGKEESRRPLRFLSDRPVSEAAAQHWRDTLQYVMASLQNEAVAREALVVGNLGRLLSSAALMTFPTTLSLEATIEDRRDAHPVTVRRALDFLESHALDDLSVGDVAAAAHVSVRALQLAFRRHLGSTPMAELRRVRLQHVREALLDADPAVATVSAIAASWGFPNHSRFSQAYRAQFGVPPSVTLRS